jgi:hypothetical protein
MAILAAPTLVHSEAEAVPGSGVSEDEKALLFVLS